MIKFTTPAEGQASVIARVDRDGDVVIEVNGVAVLYIDKTSGALVPMFFEPSEAELLRSLGFETKSNVSHTAHRLRCDGWHLGEDEL